MFCLKNKAGVTLYFSYCKKTKTNSSLVRLSVLPDFLSVALGFKPTGPF